MTGLVISINEPVILPNTSISLESQWLLTKDDPPKNSFHDLQKSRKDDAFAPVLKSDIITR